MAQQILTTTAPALGLTATGDQVIGEVKKAGVVSSVTYTPEAAITGAASPASRTFTVVNKGTDGLGSTTVATLAMVSGVDGVAFDEKAITLSGTAANLVVAAGDILVFVSTAVGGTGLADPGGEVQVEIDAAGYTTTVGAAGAVTHTQS